MERALEQYGTLGVVLLVMLLGLRWLMAEQKKLVEVQNKTVEALTKLSVAFYGDERVKDSGFASEVKVLRARVHKLASAVQKLLWRLEMQEEADELHDTLEHPTK